MAPLYAGIEAGGTKFVCVVGAGPDDIRAQARIATTTPEATLRETLEFFRAQRAQHGPLTAAGIASFGPVDLDPASPTYGFITSTPKAGWAQTDIVGPVRQALGVPVRFDTDVNAAALGEGRWGAAQGLDNFIYLTVGTGHRRRRARERKADARPRPSGDGPRAHPARPRRPTLRRDVPVPRRLPGGPGQRARDERALGNAGREPARRPSGLGPRGAVPRARPQQLRVHAVAAADHPGRRRDGAARLSSR